jgi:hypothetical protein
MLKLSKLFLAALIAAAMPATNVAAQADFAENFENNGQVGDGQFGPSNLISQGWIFRNQCNPVNGAAWYDGSGFGGMPFEGTGYLGADSLATDFFGGEFSVWAILPSIPNQTIGDQFSIWVFGGGSPTNDTFFEVRYAPSGTDTGSGPDDIGDFTQVLVSAELPYSSSAYQRVNAAVPGPGRIAIRFRADYLSTFAGNGAYLSLDSLTVGAPPDDPCGVPIPDPGQAATWTASGGPYTICQDLLVPVGGVVNVEPGATITFEAGNTLRIEGEFNAHGTLADPIVFSGSTSFGTGLDVSLAGQANISFAELNIGVLGGGEDAALVLTDSVIGPNVAIEGVRDLVVIERCLFDGGSAGTFSSLNGGSIRMTDSSFINGGFAHIGGLLFIDNVDVDGQPLQISSETSAHPVYIDNVSVTNYASGAGIKLSGPNFLLGENVVTQGNLYPMSFDDFSGAGLLEGSALPTTGNANNFVVAGQFFLAANRYWANTGVPYLVQGFPANYGGSLEIAPGTNIRFGPDAGAFLVGSANLIMRGTRQKPILLESDAPFAPWFGLKWVDVFDAKARHVIFDGGQISAQSDGGYLDLMNTTVRNSAVGTASVTGGFVRIWNSKIVDNDIGMTTTTSGRIEAKGDNSPNILEGNQVAVEYLNNNSTPYLRFNWWGAPTGPTDVLNPAGTGDVVNGVHPAGYTPFLSASPPQDDDFPLVEMMPTYWFANSGDKIILRWQASDDNGIVSQHVEFADHDFPSEFETVAELPADATTYEFTAPIVSPNNLYPTPSAIRIVAVDTAGQESWDKSVLRIPYQEDWTVVPQTIDYPGPVHHPHDRIDVCWSPTGFGDAWVLMDGIGINRSAGGTTAGCLPIGAGLPYSSTDTARIVVITTFGAGGRLNYSFSDYFAIRPDARFGDAPPVVELTAPTNGTPFSGGSVIPVRWNASDDEQLRSFKIQASYDGGRSWHGVAEDLPATARSFDWKLPASTGIADVRVRVIATDQRFQDSSMTVGPFEILAGDVCPADFNGDGVLDFFDVQAFLDAFSANDPSADFTHDGVFDFFDVQEFLAVFSAGCP